MMPHGMPTLVTNCSEQLRAISFRRSWSRSLSTTSASPSRCLFARKGEKCDWLYVRDHARAIDLVFHRGRWPETYNIGGFNEWKNIRSDQVRYSDLDRLLGRTEGEICLITYVTDRGPLRQAIDSSSCRRWVESLQLRGIERPYAGIWTIRPRMGPHHLRADPKEVLRGDVSESLKKGLHRESRGASRSKVGSFQGQSRKGEAK